MKASFNTPHQLCNRGFPRCIFSDLSSLSAHQVLLCFLRWYPASKTLLVYPDFNQLSGQCYDVSHLSSLVQFRLEHASPQQTEVTDFFFPSLLHGSYTALTLTSFALRNFEFPSFFLTCSLSSFTLPPTLPQRVQGRGSAREKEAEEVSLLMWKRY